MSTGLGWSGQRRTRYTSSGKPAVGPKPAGRQHHRISRRFLVLVALYLVLTTSVAAAAVKVIHTRSRAVASVPLVSGVAATPKYLVLIVLDGARPDYFGLTPLPHVDLLRSAGTQFSGAIDGILESETPAGHTTLSTGSSPARNGILGFDWAQNDSDYSLFSPDVVRAGAMEHIMEAAHVPTIAGLFKARFPRAMVVALSGHKYYAADPLGGPQADAIMYYQGDPKGNYVPVAIPGHMPPAGVLDAPGLTIPTITPPLGTEDALATRLAIAAFRRMHQRLTLINYPEFDWPLGHVDGGNLAPDKVITLMQEFDKDLGQLEDAYRKAGVLEQTLFVITADHGMEPTPRFIPQTVITNAVAQAGTQAPSISYSTGAYIWLSDTTKAQQVSQNLLNSQDPGIGSVYYLSGGATSAYVKAGGTLASPAVDQANQYLLSTLMNGHEPNVVVFAKEGQTFADSSTHWKADHGGASWQSQHIPLILSGPGIRRGEMVTAPAQLEDVAPTVLSVMGVTPTGMQGHVLTDALMAPTSAQAAARQAEIDQLTPLVNAMIAEATFEAPHTTK